MHFKNDLKADFISEKKDFQRKRCSLQSRFSAISWLRSSSTPPVAHNQHAIVDRFFVRLGLVVSLLSILFTLLSIVWLCSRLRDSPASRMERHAGFVASRFLGLLASRSNPPRGLRRPQSLLLSVCLIRVVTD